LIPNLETWERDDLSFSDVSPRRLVPNLEVGFSPVSLR
jgi:hypothetical protein